MCRHTVGLNWTAIGIEHVGTSDRQILGNTAQLSASLSLTLWLMSTFHIQLRDVIGHVGRPRRVGNDGITVSFPPARRM